MTSIFEGQPPKTRPFPIKIGVIWVPGMYIILYAFAFWCDICSRELACWSWWFGVPTHCIHLHIPSERWQAADGGNRRIESNTQLSSGTKELASCTKFDMYPDSLSFSTWCSWIAILCSGKCTFEWLWFLADIESIWFLWFPMMRAGAGCHV